MALKPCSKCGATPEIARSRGIPQIFYIQCSCGYRSTTFRSEAEAISEWNDMKKSISSRIIG